MAAASTATDADQPCSPATADATAWDGELADATQLDGTRLDATQLDATDGTPHGATSEHAAPTKPEDRFAEDSADPATRQGYPSV